MLGDHAHVLALNYLAYLSVSPADLLLYVILNEHGNADTIHRAFREDTARRVPDILTALLNCPTTAAYTGRWLQEAACRGYSDMVQDLTRKERGWHFNAVNTRAEQIQDFRVEDMRNDMQALAPGLWDLVFTMVGGNNDEVDEEVVQAEEGESEDTDEAALWSAFPSIDK